MDNLPAICTELGLRPEGAVPLVNSRDVAAHFEKRHDHVLRDIATLVGSPDLGSQNWFRETSYIDDRGKTWPSFDLTRQGFTLLVMGWTGERAMAFKVRYIQAFDAMELALNEDRKVTGTELIQAVREIVAPLAVRFDGQDRAIERIEQRQEDHSERLSTLEKNLKNVLKFRRKISPKTKSEHLDAIIRLGRRCPVYPEIIIVDAAGSVVDADYDHFFTNQLPNENHTWLISNKAHDDITYERLSREEATKLFVAYHYQRRRLPGRQIALLF